MYITVLPERPVRPCVRVCVYKTDHIYIYWKKEFMTFAIFFIASLYALCHHHVNFDWFMNTIWCGHSLHIVVTQTEMKHRLG
jgi:hypothetical protein